MSCPCPTIAAIRSRKQQQHPINKRPSSRAPKNIPRIYVWIKTHTKKNKYIFFKSVLVNEWLMNSYICIYKVHVYMGRDWRWPSSAPLIYRRCFAHIYYNFMYAKFFFLCGEEGGGGFIGAGKWKSTCESQAICQSIEFFFLSCWMFFLSNMWPEMYKEDVILSFAIILSFHFCEIRFDSIVSSCTVQWEFQNTRASLIFFPVKETNPFFKKE